MWCKPCDYDLSSILDTNVILNIELFLHAVAHLEIVVKQKSEKNRYCEYEGDLRSDEHYLSNSENKAITWALMQL